MDWNEIKQSLIKEEVGFGSESNQHLELGINGKVFTLVPQDDYDKTIEQTPYEKALVMYLNEPKEGKKAIVRHDLEYKRFVDFIEQGETLEMTARELNLDYQMAVFYFMLYNEQELKNMKALEKMLKEDE